MSSARGTVRRAAIAVLAVPAALALAACGTAAGTRFSPGELSRGFRIGIALPEDQTARYEAYDRPMLTARIRALCPACHVDYANATGDANVQQQQIDTLVDEGDKAVIVDPVDYRAIGSSVDRAHRRGVRLVAYDRLAEGPVDGYVSFDNTLVGEEQGRALLAATGAASGSGTGRPGTTPAAAGRRKPTIIMINGDPGDPNAAQFKAGAHRVLDGRVTVAAEYDTGGWLASVAGQEVAGALSRLGGRRIDGVYCANDGMAAGVIAALRAAHVSPLPPVGGQDAELDGVQRVLAGSQAFTVYKPYRREADAAARMAVALATGAPVRTASRPRGAGGRPIPTELIPTAVLTRRTIRQTVIAGGLFSAARICAGRYAAYCARDGLG